MNQYLTIQGKKITEFMRLMSNNNFFKDWCKIFRGRSEYSLVTFVALLVKLPDVVNLVEARELIEVTVFSTELIFVELECSAVTDIVTNEEVVGAGISLEEVFFGDVMYSSVVVEDGVNVVVLVDNFVDSVSSGDKEGV